ncbi:glycosyltransferase family 2 protein [Leptolyngbya sp. PCC 6406]|uniref:glycosyltransferase family 2 protein n=1 Tax=Leptolyngbya sp. PCC 6406 TaxID=1173264 RepID=UPI0002ABA0BD|nr:glycosyltransferase family 2 protein [Leptolyngbya sp. PCC 6406]
MKLSFSVITPSYQQGHFIEETIQSVLTQKDIEPTDIEYIVCDGGSTDQTIDILKAYEGKLRWLSEPDGGQSDAVNKGIEMTDGDIIAWINSDDIYYSDSFSIVRKIFEGNPDIEVVYGDANWIDEFGSFLAKYPVEEWDYQRLKKACYICQPAVFFRRSIVRNLGALNVNLNYCMDYELWLRYGCNNNFFYVDTVLAGARMYSSNKSLGGRLDAHKEVNAMLFEKIHYVPTTWIASYALVKSERENNLDKYNDKDLRKLIIYLIFNSLSIAIHRNIMGIPEILLKSVFWLLLPKQTWFKRAEPILKEIGW